MSKLVEKFLGAGERERVEFLCGICTLELKFPGDEVERQSFCKFVN